MHLAKIEKDVVLVGVQFGIQTLLVQFLVAANIFHPGNVIAEDGVMIGVVVQPQAIAERLLYQDALIASHLDGESSRNTHPTAYVGKTVMIQHQAALTAGLVGIGIYIFVDIAFRRVKIIQQEIGYLGKQVAAPEQREDFTLMPFDQMVIHLLIPICPAELHAVFFGKALELSMPKHRQAGQRGH